MLLAYGHGRSYNTVRSVLHGITRKTTTGKSTPVTWLSSIDSCTTSSYSRQLSTTPCRASNFDQSPGLHAHGVLGCYTPKPTPNPRAHDVAVIGGGITGLSAAFHLTRDLPHANVTVYEQTDRLGGWVDSEQVEVDDGTVLFEWGPRTLRPDRLGNGLATLQLIHLLGVAAVREVRYVHKALPAATNRYVYYPDHLVRMPGPNPESSMFSLMFNALSTIMTEPLFKGVLSRAVREPSQPVRQASVRDESIGDFISRRFGSGLADNLTSALFHGIYAGDIYKLSARTLLPLPWHLEVRDADDGHGILPEMADLFFKGHVIFPFEKLGFAHRVLQDLKDQPGFLGGLIPNMAAANVYSFTKGLGQLKDLILDNLTKNPRVKIVRHSHISDLDYDSNSRKVTLRPATDAEPQKYDYVVCTASQKSLGNMLAAPTPASQGIEKSTKLKSRLEASHPSAPNVMVVNLYYAEESLPIPPGFGYLIPRTVPAEQNPERALGVIFASETAGPKGKDAFQTNNMQVAKREEMTESLYQAREFESMQDFLKWQEENLEWKDVTMQMGQDTASGTKLAVMLGGHWWDGWSEADLPSEEEGIAMAKSIIARHLGIEFEPVIAKARLQKNCIPQYHVGFGDEMGAVHRDLMQNFQGRLKVGGVWWQGGVGVNDCVRSGRETSRTIREAWDDTTGLEKYTENDKFVLTEKRTGRQTMDPLQR